MGAHRSVVAVAHRVEHRIVTPEVAGSRPVGHPILSLEAPEILEAPERRLRIA